MLPARPADIGIFSSVLDHRQKVFGGHLDVVNPYRPVSIVSICRDGDRLAPCLRPLLS
jgi:hypothetical protein